MKHKNLLFCLCIFLIILFLSFWIVADLRHLPHRSPIKTTPDPQRPMVAFTFDDGPQRPYTEQILNILYEHQVPATFFLLGENLSHNIPIIQDMYACGHELANHSFSHPDFTQILETHMRLECEKTQTALNTILPHYQMQYFRPPYGHSTPNLENTIGLPVVLWSVDSGDWNAPHADSIYFHVVNTIKDGDIVIFHDDNEETVKALPKIIQNLKDRGFQFVTISQLQNTRPSL